MALPKKSIYAWFDRHELMFLKRTRNLGKIRKYLKQLHSKKNRAWYGSEDND